MIYLTLATDSPHPKAGDQFTVLVTLEKAATEPLTVTSEKHRVYVDASWVRPLIARQW
jgi:hypothetical protein